MSEPKWLIKARSYLGTKETPGRNFNPVIKKWFAYAGHKEVTDDVTPWCAAFANLVERAQGRKGTGKLNARSFLNYGVAVKEPQPGDILVFTRGNNSWQGHVTFYVATEGSNYMCVGGNQGDKVCYRLYPKHALLGIRRTDA